MLLAMPPIWPRTILAMAQQLGGRGVTFFDSAKNTRLGMPTWRSQMRPKAWGILWKPWSPRGPAGWQKVADIYNMPVHVFQTGDRPVYRLRTQHRPPTLFAEPAPRSASATVHERHALLD